ncbi:MAG: NADAR family protein [Gemmataceae bacterium]
MARPPTELQWLVLGRSPRAIYRTLAAEGCLTAAAARDRRAIIADLKQQLACLPTGWTVETDARGERTGRFVPVLGGRTLYGALLDVLQPYLNDKGLEMAHTIAAGPPPQRPPWWQFWKRPWFAAWRNAPRRAAGPPLPADGRVLFYKRDRAAFGFLSNFHPAPIALDGESWPTVEHYYQAQKSADPEYRRAVRAAGTPGHAKRLGAAPGGSRRRAGQSWFRRNGQEPRADWDAAKLDVMRIAVRAKFAQNPGLAAALRATGTAELVEDSATDAFWGVGADGAGQNWLGRVLMDVRRELAAACSDGTPELR